MDFGPLAAKATLTVDLSGVTSNTGFRFNNHNFRVLDSGATANGTVDITLTKGEGSPRWISLGSYFSYKFDGSNLTIKANDEGAEYNNYRITDGYSYVDDDPDDMITYTAYSALNASAISTVQTAANGEAASYTLELAGMTVDDFSDKYSGKLLTVKRYTSSSSSMISTTYKFFDSGKTPKLESFDESQDTGTRNDKIIRTPIDINDIRQRVNSGSTLAQALQAKLGGTVDGDNLKITSPVSAGAAGNNGTVTFTEETLRHYDIDFSNLNVKMPEGLYGKGFRAYCATDNREWFNFVFTDGTDSYNIDKDNIKNIDIDVSAVTNTKNLLQTIIDQANPILTGDDLKFNHHMRLAADLDKKVLTIYDHRRFDVSKPPYDYQERGAKIADGVSFKEDYEREKRNFSVKDLVIQHTDKANMNIHILIPQMTLDHIFDPLPELDKTIFDYPVTDKESRDALLGKPNPPGILDIGLQYLLDAATLVGAQNRRLEFTAENVTTELENLTASESTIRDADMAKEMVEYTKSNVLAQASQAMLAQANQNHSLILSLLQ